MTVGLGSEGPDEGAAWTILSAWRRQSALDGWRFPGDWQAPETALVVAALTCSMPLNESATLLGAARAQQGVGIAESIADYQALFSCLGYAVDCESLQSLAAGWVEANETCTPLSCVDPVTGLATAGHFQAMLQHAVMNEACPSCDYLQGEIVFPSADAGYRPGWALLAELGQIYAEELPPGAVVELTHGAEARFLLPSTPNNLAKLQSCHARVQSLRPELLGPAQLSYHPLRGTDNQDNDAPAGT
ncbi:hypothetical protein [Arthrobacter sp. NA-172]|uniref:hypothetical protein n=1 Tax=Arthrobacter sp. NA-172 TaxID=3367524 RepID=UPI003755281F